MRAQDVVLLLKILTIPAPVGNTGILPATLADLDEKAISYFLQLALKSGRIPTNADRYNALELLENIELLNEGGELRNATLLLFGKRSMKYLLSESSNLAIIKAVLEFIHFQATSITELLVLQLLLLKPVLILSVVRLKCFI
jgi:predicted HTH transcriptional regulator